VTRVLAVDTSTWWGGAALVEQDLERGCRTVAEIGVQVRDSHATRLLGWVEGLLAEAGWSREDLDAYAATLGPGSFTGIRVGLGFLRGLAVATSRPIVGVKTLEAIAQAHGPAEGDRIALLDASRGQLYAAVYDATSDPPVEKLDARICPCEPFPAELAAPGSVAIPAPGTPVPGTLPSGVRRAAPAHAIAAAAGSLALERLASGRPLDPLAPLYIRPPDIARRRS
jgi:tRNA threonylcarbamoyladenosine biosynthesis protein TsaB